MAFTKDGTKVLYKLKRRWRDGSTHVVFDPLTLIERLAALVPRPRVHLTTYHGVFAPAASYRDRIVPAPPEAPASHASCEHDDEPPEQEPSPPPGPRPRRYSWAELMKRVFEIEVLICPHCNGRRKLLAFITDSTAIRRILEHLELPADPPRMTPARAPPELALPFA